jgi:hypothetical protein
MLVDAITDQVVWLSYIPKVIPPIVDPSLNYKNYRGHPEFDVTQEYLKFKLFFDMPNKSLIVKEQPFDTKQEEERIRFLRDKCQVFDVSNGLYIFYGERIDLPNTSYLHSVPESFKNEWISVYEDTYGCSKENAVKLLDFKINEYQRSYFTIESARLQMLEDLKNAKTTDELKFIYDTTNIKMFNVDGIQLFN